MDSSHWRNCQPRVVLQRTTKLFYNQYLCKLAYNLQDARYINRFAAGTIPLETKTSYWANSQRPIDRDSLEDFRKAKSAHKLKFRVDDSTFTVYANTEDELKKFNDSLPVHHRMRVESVSIPDPTQLAQLANGEIVTPDSQRAGKLKVIVRDGKYDVALLKTIVTWLTDSPEVELTASIEKLGLDRYQAYERYIYGCYFYVNDETTITMLNLMHPGFVRKWHKISAE